MLAIKMYFNFYFRLKKMATMETMQTQPTENTTTTTYHYETTYSGNTGNDLGISTAGYRTGKYNPDEWHTANYTITYESALDCDKAGKVTVIIIDIIIIIIISWIGLIRCGRFVFDSGDYFADFIDFNRFLYFVLWRFGLFCCCVAFAILAFLFFYSI